MTSRAWLVCGAVLGGLGLAFAAGRGADEREERIAAGRVSFHLHCASCHGEGGRGDGTLADMFKVRPSDLTRLSRDNGGTFPHDRVYRIVDGRDEVRGHGPGSMPVWGLTFLLDAPETGREESVAERIRDLLAFVESIQEGEGKGAARR